MNTVKLGHLGRMLQEWMDFQPLGGTQRKLAKELKVSPSTVGAWMHGTSLPGPEKLEKLSEFTRIPKETLLDAALRDHGYRSPPEGRTGT